MTNDEEMAEFAERIKSMGIEKSEGSGSSPCSGLGWRCGMTSDPLCEILYDLAELMEYLGHASLYVRRARDRFEDADEPDDTIAVLAAQSKARAAGLAFREVERMARVMAETVEDWAAYTREEKCPDCNGTGLQHVGGRASKEIGECVTCHGRKFLSQNSQAIGTQSDSDQRPVQCLDANDQNTRARPPSKYAAPFQGGEKISDVK